MASSRIFGPIAGLWTVTFQSYDLGFEAQGLMAVHENRQPWAMDGHGLIIHGWWWLIMVSEG